MKEIVQQEGRLNHMPRPVSLGERIQQLEKKLDKLAYEICEVDFDFDINSPKNMKYAKLREELAELYKEKNDLCRVFMAHTY
ncbi:hypothetical protein P9436_21905 [Lysinibacillus capsici]|uniref:hypothetical protein n=2 Tax=Lysinibacillus capsici TaxID=2115968 RepID=UPI002E1A2BBD|nr:hypothetical protein [Lysinibacillus capsici]